MDESEFIELQKECFNVVSGSLKGQVNLIKNIAISTINRTVLTDISSYVKNKYIHSNAEFYMSTLSTSGVGLPIRIVVYYDKKPLGYLSGSYDDSKFMLYHWELSYMADAELHSNWLRIVIISLESLAVGFESYTGNKSIVESIAFTSPTQGETKDFTDAKFKYSYDFLKGIPACYIDR